MRLADSWSAWIADNLLRGAEPNEIVAALVDDGVPPKVAARELHAIVSNAAFDAGRVHSVRAKRLALAMRLVEQTCFSADSIEQRETIDEETFYASFFRALKPLVVTRQIAEWPALKRWSLDDLASRFGDATVQICSGREGDATPDLNFASLLEDVTVKQLVGRLRAAEGTNSNDFYLIANNHVLRDTALGGLLNDVAPPPFMHPVITPTSTSLWIGPAGTVTPLHHDNCNIFFCQIVGAKRFRLFPPISERLLASANGFYADPALARDPDLGGLEVTLEPGMCLFLPMGWWHEVRSLETSISISLLRFREPSTADWYAPGNIRS